MKKVLFATITMVLIASSAQAYQNIYVDDVNGVDGAYRRLASGNAIMIDVRTAEEWAWVGHPGANKSGDGAEIAQYVVNIAWEIEKPGHGYELILNNLFLGDVAKLNLPSDMEIITICRSGGRSVAAALALESAGYTNVYNTLEGFEGGTDTNGYRTRQQGWKNKGFPYAFGYTGNIDDHIPGN